MAKVTASANFEMRGYHFSSMLSFDGGVGKEVSGGGGSHTMSGLSESSDPVSDSSLVTDDMAVLARQ